MKKIVYIFTCFLVLITMVGCGSLTADEIMSQHLDKGPSISLDESMYTYMSTLDATFSNAFTNTQTSITTVYLYAYQPMGNESQYAYAYIIVEDIYAFSNGASLVVDGFKYIMIYSDEQTATQENQNLLIQNSRSILDEYRISEGLEVPTLDLSELISNLNPS